MTRVLKWEVGEMLQTHIFRSLREEERRGRNKRCHIQAQYVLLEDRVTIHIIICIKGRQIINILAKDRAVVGIRGKRATKLGLVA